MGKIIVIIVRAALSALCSVLMCPVISKAAQYTNFDVSIYIPVGVVRNLDDPQTLSNQWSRISSQLKVDKVYIEVQRDRNMASDEMLERIKKFFLDHGVKVAGGMAASSRRFATPTPADHAFIKSAAEPAARHFDELIQDDFFFNTHPGKKVHNQEFYRRDLPSQPKNIVTLDLSHLPKGKYTVETYKVGYRVSDAYDTYRDLDSPAQLTMAQVAEIKSKNSGAPLEVRTVKIGRDEKFEQQFDLRENDIVLITLKPER